MFGRKADERPNEENAAFSFGKDQKKLHLYQSSTFSENRGFSRRGTERLK